jgi:DNA end-binding protein Ku
MRTIWKGAISFGLVNIPVALYPATQRDEIKFRLLRKKDLSPVSYKRVAQADGKEVPWDQIVKGYEYEKEKFVVIKDEDFEKVDIESTQTVDIIDFVAEDEINPVFFSKPYYMEPTKGGTKAYVLIRDALRETGKVGIAKVVIKTRQYLAAVKPNDTGLVLELMHFADELSEPGDLHLPTSAKISKGEMEMAKSLIEKMTHKWNPENYKDDYRDAMMKLIQKKVDAGGREIKAPPAKSKHPTPVVDLLSVLRQSLAQGKKTAGKSRRNIASHRATKPFRSHKKRRNSIRT